MADYQDPQTDFIVRVRDTIEKRLEKIRDEQAEAIHHYMGIRGNRDIDCQALANAVASMLEQTSDDIAEEIRRQNEGERVTIRRCAHKHPEPVREKIRREYNGSNMAEITERYGVSRGTVYNYCK